MEDQLGHTRIGTRNRTFYVVQEPLDKVHAQIESGEWVHLISVTGQALMPSEQLVLRSEEIVSLQAISPEAWLWQKQADELHYARQLQELGESPAERQVAAQERLVEVIRGAHGDDA